MSEHDVTVADRPDGPDRIGPYRVVRPLGRGGMGEVYLAVDERPGAAVAQVAVKVLRPELQADEGFRRRFARELGAVRRVHGRSVARVLDANLEAARPWIATEYVPGPTLGAARGDVDLHALAAGLARALADIHAAGVVHRDLTPANVLLGPDGPRVVDFGIAWFDDTTTLTRTGMVLGTPAWMAPEQLGDDRTTPASDVWAWGAVLVFAAAGHPPVRGSRPEVLQVRAARGKLDLDGVPDWLHPLVARALDPDPGRRPTAAQLAIELGVPTDAALTEVLERTWVGGGGASTAGVPAPIPGGPTATAPVGPTALEAPEPAPVAGAPSGTAVGPPASRRVPAWVPRWLPGIVLALLGATFASIAGFLAVVLAVTILVVVAACVRIWEVERLPRPPVAWVPSPSSLVVAGLATAGSGLAAALGVVWGLLALVAIVVFLVAIGAHGG